MPSPTPLLGRRIAVTRPRAVARELMLSLEDRGAEAISFPTIDIRPTDDLSPLDAALRQLHSYDWVIFTSVNGVDITCRRMEEIGLDRSMLRRPRIAAIGPATKGALEQNQLQADLVPNQFIAEGILEHLPAVDGLRILLPRARGARVVLPQQLEQRGARVDEISIYEAVPTRPNPEALAQLRRGLDAITFTSPSTVEGFLAIATQEGLDPLALPGSPLFACIGPVTGDRVQQAELLPRLVADTYTGPGLVQALTSHFATGEST